VAAGACPASETGWSSRGSGSGGDLEDLGLGGGSKVLGSMSAKRGHSRQGDGEVLRARQGREEANIHINSRYIYK